MFELLIMLRSSVCEYYSKVFVDGIKGSISIALRVNSFFVLLE